MVLMIDCSKYIVPLLVNEERDRREKSREVGWSIELFVVFVIGSIGSIYPPLADW